MTFNDHLNVPKWRCLTLQFRTRRSNIWSGSLGSQLCFIIGSVLNEDTTKFHMSLFQSPTVRKLLQINCKALNQKRHLRRQKALLVLGELLQAPRHNYCKISHLKIPSGSVLLWRQQCWQPFLGTVIHFIGAVWRGFLPTLCSEVHGGSQSTSLPNSRVVQKMFKVHHCMQYDKL